MSGDTVNYDIGGDLNITSVQDHEDSENSGFGLDVSTTGISGSFNSGDSDRDVVNEQSGITAQNGTSGSIGGDVNLEGSYLVDESGTGTLTVDGTVNSTDIDNTANVSSTSISGGMNFGGPTDTPKNPANDPSKPASSLNLPSHKENDTSSTTHSVLAGITVTDGQGNTITTDHIRDTLDGANETLKDPAEEDLNALEIFAGTLVAVELNNQIGNLAMFNDSKDENAGWQEGGVNKVVTHFLNGSLTHLLTGGDSSDALSAGFGAAAVEATMAHLNTGDAANDQLVASLIGGAVSSLTGGSFDDGAISGAFAESFNRQMHDAEIQWIKENAQAFADKHGLTQEEAEARLTQQALKTIDYLWGLYLPELTDTQAAEFLQVANATFVNEEGDAQTLFTAQGDDYLDRGKYLNDDQAKADFYQAMIGHNANGLSYERLLAGDFEGGYTAGDRDADNRIWKGANAWNLMQEDGNLAYDSIRDRLEFYGWFQNLSDSMGHETRWAGAAREVAKGVDLLAQITGDITNDTSPGELDVSGEGVMPVTLWSALPKTIASELNAFSNEGNQVIFDNAFPKLNVLISSPPVTGNSAYNWDAITLSEEQNLTQPMYGELSGLARFGVAEAARQRVTLMSELLEYSYGIDVDLKPFKRDITQPPNRWAYGMEGMGYKDIRPEDMPRPSGIYLNGDALGGVRR